MSGRLILIFLLQLKVHNKKELNYYNGREVHVGLKTDFDLGVG